MTYISK